MNKALTMSKDGTAEYCCCVVRIGQLLPIKNSDFLATVDIYGTKVIVRKDQVKEGDIMFYAMHETQLNPKFLSQNNLYELSSRNLNSNKNEVNAIMQEYDDKYTKIAQPFKDSCKASKLAVEALKFSCQKISEEINNLEERVKTEHDEEFTVDIAQQILKYKDKITEKQNQIKVLEINIENARISFDKILEKGKPLLQLANKQTGFFDKQGRVKYLKLKEQVSYGYLFSINEMAQFNPKIKSVNLEEYIGQNFDTVFGETFVRVFVPPTPEVQSSSKRKQTKIAEKRLKRLEHIVEGQFKFHYDATPLDTRILYNIKPTDKLTISVKLHGTSVIIGKLLVKNPINSWVGKIKKVWHDIVKFTHLPQILDCVYYTMDYGPIYSPRRIVKNKYLNDKLNDGFYECDIYTMYGDIMYPYLNEGMTLYGEIIGYQPNGSPIQKYYDYRCGDKESKLMVYRITTTLKDGSVYEWEISEIQQFIEHLISKNENLSNLLHPIDVLYHGNLLNLYPHLDVAMNWQENVLHELQNDSIHFGMEELEPLCKNRVPREGICIRIDSDPIAECFKVKTNAFKLKEAALIDAGEIDIEMINNN